MADVETQFKAALDVIQSLPKNGSYKPSPETMLHFYSLYKQATEGRCNRSKPWAFDVINKAKWDAWNKLGDMPKEKAMQNYVTELTQIIEALPASDEAANFIETLGTFYEIVDPESENAKELKKYGNSKKINGDHPPLPNGGSDHQPINATSSPDNQETTNHLTPDRKLSEDDENSDSENDEVVEIDQNAAVEKDRSPIEDRTVGTSDSDEEFCDTSAEVTSVTPRRRDNSGSHSTSTLSSASFSGSPAYLNDKLMVPEVLSKQPTTRGGEKGTHGVDESVQFDQQIEQVSLVAPLSQPNFSSPSAQGLSTTSGGGGEDRNPSDNNRQSEVQERIAVALLQLQRDMHSVLNRLTTLETITIARQQDLQYCRRCCALGSEKKPSWWMFDGLSSQTILFILAWPFLARLLVSIWTKSRLRRRR